MDLDGIICKAPGSIARQADGECLRAGRRRMLTRATATSDTSGELCISGISTRLAFRVGLGILGDQFSDRTSIESRFRTGFGTDTSARLGSSLRIAGAVSGTASANGCAAVKS